MLTFLLGLMIGILITGIALLYLFYCKFVVTNKGLRNILEIFNSYDKEYWEDIGTEINKHDEKIDKNYKEFWKKQN